MTDNSFSSRLRQLSKDYYQHHLGFDDYRAQRRNLLEQIDEEFNGRKIEPAETQPDLEKSSIFLKTIAFFQNSDVPEKNKSD